MYLSQVPGMTVLCPASFAELRRMLRRAVEEGRAASVSGCVSAALEQYQLASAAPGDDFYLRSSIEARMRELRSRLDAQRQAGRL